MTCAACGHAHTGPEYGGICIGCPCEFTAFEFRDLPRRRPHRCHLEQRRVLGTRLFESQAVCTCGWVSEWWADGTDAVDASLAHQGTAR